MLLMVSAIKRTIVMAELLAYLDRQTSRANFVSMGNTLLYNVRKSYE